MRSERSFRSSDKDSFVTIYAAVCAKYKTRPVQGVKVNGKTNFVEVLGDRMKADDWQAAMEALSIDSNTHHLRVKNRRYMDNLYKDYNTFSSAMEAPK